MAAQAITSTTTRIFSAETFSAILKWALTPFTNGLTSDIQRTETQTVSQIRSAANKAEKEWGNSMIGQKSNGNWTTLLGEGLVHDVLAMRGENPRKPERKNGYEPDWETDNYIYEVKTRNWTTSGTAGRALWTRALFLLERVGKITLSVFAGVLFLAISTA